MRITGGMVCRRPLRAILAVILAAAAPVPVGGGGAAFARVVMPDGVMAPVAPGERRADPQGAVYGPFRVLDPGRAALVDATDGRSPAAFVAMLRDWPGIAILEMVDCPGTDDDTANLRLGRMIRQRGIVTHVPAHGSVRSGAVELFLAGVRRKAEPGARFAVHAWADTRGREPGDFAPDDPVNRAYLDYYRQMGMSPIEADSFYAMTNAVPNAQARWMSSAQMAMWIRFD